MSTIAAQYLLEKTETRKAETKAGSFETVCGPLHVNMTAIE